jgi:hypothetical protein
MNAFQPQRCIDEALAYALISLLLRADQVDGWTAHWENIFLVPLTAGIAVAPVVVLS